MEEESSGSKNVQIDQGEESVANPTVPPPPPPPHSDGPTPAPTPTRRNRGRPKRTVSDSECSIQSTASSKGSNSKGKTSTSSAGKRKRKEPWTLEDKQKFVTSMSHIDEFRKADGNMNWPSLAKSIGKTVKEVKDFVNNFNALENDGKTYEEFVSKAAVDVWRQLAGSLTMPGDNIDQMCIPQTLTVAALEPVAGNPYPLPNQPNYGNIYNYLSAVTRGTEAQDLPPNDAVVVLELLEDLIKWLSKSQTLIQREFMHHRYAELRSFLDPASQTGEGEGEGRQYNTSTNPFAIPFDILEFRGEGFAGESST